MSAPNEPWLVGINSATRTDGVHAGFLFPKHNRAFAAYRTVKDKREMLQSRVGVARCFFSLAAAMAAVDKEWPLP